MMMAAAAAPEAKAAEKTEFKRSASMKPALRRFRSSK